MGDGTQGTGIHKSTIPAIAICQTLRPSGFTASCGIISTSGMTGEARAAHTNAKEDVVLSDELRAELEALTRDGGQRRRRGCGRHASY